MAISLAHKLAKRLAQVRKDGTLAYLRPDGKTQVTVEYDETTSPARIDTVVVSNQHSPDVSTWSRSVPTFWNMWSSPSFPLNCWTMRPSTL